MRSINGAYRGLADERRNVLQHRVFYETQGTPAGVIVDEASADPGLPGDLPIPVDADHISIVKPLDRSSIIYARTRDLIAKNLAPPTQEGKLEICSLPPIRSEQSLNIVPKLIRIAAIVLVGLIGYKGVQSLIAPPPPIEIKKAVEEQGKENERHHKEEMAEIKAVRLDLANKYGVLPDVLRPLFENLGMIGLTPDQMREKAPEAIKAILARANAKIEPSKDGVDIDKTIAASRAKLGGLDTAGAEAILDKKIAQEVSAISTRETDWAVF